MSLSESGCAGTVASSAGADVSSVSIVRRRGIARRLG